MSPTRPCAQRAITRRITQMVDKKDLILSQLSRNMRPDGYLEHGTLTKVAIEFGLSRERIRQIAARHGLYTAPRAGKTCSVCHVSIGANSKTGLCKPHLSMLRWAWYPCEGPGCGKLVRRRIAHEKWKVEKSKRPYKGRVFCNKTCYGRWFGVNHGWGAQRKKREQVAVTEG